MSTAKQMVMNELLNVSDDEQDEFEVLENEIQIHEVHNWAKMIRHFNA